MHLSKKAPIVYLKVDKALTEVSNKYTDFIDVFLPELAIKLPKHINIKNDAIKLVDD